MTIELDDSVLTRAAASEKDVRMLIAITLFREDIFTLGQAASFALVPQLIFQKELAKHKIPVHYDVHQLHQDIKNLNLF